MLLKSTESTIYHLASHSIHRIPTKCVRSKMFCFCNLVRFYDSHEATLGVGIGSKLATHLSYILQRTFHEYHECPSIVWPISQFPTNFPMDFPISPWIFRCSHGFSPGFSGTPGSPSFETFRAIRPSTLGVKRWAQPAWRRQGSILGDIVNDG